MASDLAPLLRPADVVMPFQNGLGAGERVASHVPGNQIIIGIAEMGGGLTDRVRQIEQLWNNAGFNVRAHASPSDINPRPDR